MKVEDILSYEGNQIDILLNYTDLLAATLVTLLLFQLLPVRVQGWRRFNWILVWIALAIFQVSLCLVVLCSGISIIWSALDGFNIYFFVLFYLKLRLYQRRDSLLLTFLVLISWTYSVSLWIYYAVVADTLTTIAHLAALLLGLLIAVSINFHLFSDLHPNNNEEEQQLLVM